MIRRPPTAITVARVQAIEIAVNWRWLPVLALVTWLLAHDVLPARFPGWDLSLTWVTSAAAVLAGEAALLLHELSHALVARWYGLQVRRIVFHGFLAQTLVEDDIAGSNHPASVALVGPATNVLLAGLAEIVRLALLSQGPLDVFLVMLIVGNAAAALLSVVPLGSSDGARALASFRRR